jgi:hypothetical protein
MMTGTWRRVAETKGHTGHKRVTLWKEGQGYTQSVHRLVLEAFRGPCPAGQQCRHLDGNPANNRLDNLAWGTPKQDAADKIIHGTIARGERHGRAKLTDNDVRVIRRILADGGSQSLAARWFAVSKGTIQDIARGKNWRWLPDATEPGRSCLKPAATPGGPFLLDGAGLAATPKVAKVEPPAPAPP